MSEPALIVGLGNPGREYRETRHNAGFMLVDRLAESWGGRWRKEQMFFAELTEATFEGRRFVLCKPQTFMNASGECVQRVAAYYKVAPADVLVLVDDADLPLGTLRLRPEGSPGGHHGLESIERHLGSRGYPRLRIGIARPDSKVREITGHVLGRFTADEIAVLESVLCKARRQVETWATEGISKAMSLLNGPVE